MNRTELQNIEKDILEEQKRLLTDNREDWEMGKYSITQAYEEAIKEVCILK